MKTYWIFKDPLEIKITDFSSLAIPFSSVVAKPPILSWTTDCFKLTLNFPISLAPCATCELVAKFWLMVHDYYIKLLPPILFPPIYWLAGRCDDWRRSKHLRPWGDLLIKAIPSREDKKAGSWHLSNPRPLGLNFV